MRTDVVHHVVCRHQVEVEVWPARAEVNFRDERAANPANTQMRFEATVYNAAVGGLTWEVLDLAGQPGAGSIDQSGLYLAPPKGARPSGTTDVVVATSTEDPLRRAYAWVTLLGHGPAAVAPPRVQVTPKSLYLYYPQGQQADHQNELIDDSNTVQMFRATVRDAGESSVEWLVDNVLKANTPPSTLFRYEVLGAGAPRVVVITARLQNHPAVKDEAKVMQVNYSWPRMKPVGQL